jgi:acyl-CoA synthetase (AMP-forming)/AMP-acid ligase II
MADRPRTLPEALRRAAREHAERPAVVVGGTGCTFADLLEDVRRTARGYAALGVAPGDRVCVWAPNGLDWIVAALAVSYAGGTLVPLNTRYRGHEVVELVRRTGARLLVAADGFLGRAQLREVTDAAAEEGRSEGPVVPGLPSLRAVVRLGDGAAPAGVTPYDALARLAERVPAAEVEARADAVAPDDVADILFTSGTTGRPKGVLTAHRQTLAAAHEWAANNEVTAADRYLMVNPFFHSFGYKAGIVVSLLTGCTMYPHATFDAEAVLDQIDRERITVLPGAPTVFTSLFACPDLEATDLSSLRLAVTGAASVPVALVERMQTELTFDHVVTAFGMTECVVATMCRLGDPDELVATTCGAPVGDVELRIVDPASGKVLGPGAEGEVQFRGPMVMRGYLDDPAATAEAVDPEGWLHTGDVGKVDERGYLSITDRLKDMYICGGFNVYPAEVEQALARLDGVLESAVVAVPDERLGEVGRAFVVRRAGAAVDADDVTGFLRERLAKFKVPREVVFVDELPRNLAGKVLKTELRSKQ